MVVDIVVTVLSWASVTTPKVSIRWYFFYSNVDSLSVCMCVHKRILQRKHMYKKCCIQGADVA